MIDKLDIIMDEFDDSLWAMAAEIERLRAERDAAKWIPVEDRLPSDGDANPVLVWGRGTYEDDQEPGKWCVSMATYAGSLGWLTDFYTPRSEITHWMPLPPAPDVTNPVTDEE